MQLFLSTLGQTGFLGLLIGIGYLLTRLKAVPDNAPTVLSKMENNVFVPALVLGTFIPNFTPDKLATAGTYLLAGFVAVLISIPVAILCARFCSRDSYIRKIYTYGLAFSNFGFMGNAVVNALFPQIFMDYLVFTLPFWALIYLYGVPTLLIPTGEGNGGLKQRLKAFCNPMFASLLIGILLGLLSVKLPEFLQNGVNTLGSCMSPVAMLLTGMTVAKLDLLKTIKNLSIHAVSFLRLVVIPLVWLAAVVLLKLPKELALCIIACQAMPLGLSTVVVPSAYGLDTSAAAGMALISHVLSCITIPVIFLLFNLFFP